MVDNDRDIKKEDPKLKDIPEITDNKGEVYEEGEEGVVYSPNNPGSHQQAEEAKKILKKEDRNEQA